MTVNLFRVHYSVVLCCSHDISSFIPLWRLLVTPVCYRPSRHGSNDLLKTSQLWRLKKSLAWYGLICAVFFLSCSSVNACCQLLRCVWCVNKQKIHVWFYFPLLHIFLLCHVLWWTRHKFNKKNLHFRNIKKIQQNINLVWTCISGDKNVDNEFCFVSMLAISCVQKLQYFSLPFLKEWFLLITVLHYVNNNSGMAAHYRSTQVIWGKALKYC